MTEKGFELVNDEKVNRAMYGSMSRGGVLAGGVGEDATEAQLLAEYDRLGGLVRKDGNKVKMGAFYDFENKQVRKSPQIVLLFRVNGKEIEVPEGEALPLEVRAQQIAEAGAVEEKAVKGGKKGKAKAKKEEDAEDEQ